MTRPPASPPPKCAICRRPADPEFRPFCSKRCADVDLQRWFSGAYAVPAVEQEEVSDDED
ncbi:DNA gyrase inhibitor YacG [Phenylobacterium sp.]|uniref:DNA gyrase inhibitor YacG n=1 Tax=Phenylobacterium sp. TaxID=1871053 RepID=UPI00260C6AED|nr:DNA gyrase inhibitor YacG [Phenylobacterium sp.]